MTSTSSYYSNFSDVRQLNRYHRNVSIYFDAADALSCIFGIYDYYNEDSRSFKKKEFLQAERSLVYALVSIGMLGKIHLSIPHQGEFIKNLERNNIYYDPYFKESLKHFLIDVIKENDDQSKNAYKVSKSNTTALKILMAMSPNHWQQRTLDLLDSRKLIILGKEHLELEREDADEDFLKLAASLFAYFEERRPDKTINNEIDSIALELFAKKVKLANDCLKNTESSLNELEIPIYFDRDGEILIFLDNNPEIKKQFTLVLPGQEAICLVREPKFFFCYSLYMANIIEPSDSSSSQIFSIALPQHAKTIDRLEEDISGYKEITDENFVSTQRHDARSLDTKLEQYFNFEFIINVVIPSFTDQTSRTFIEDLKKNYIKPNHILFDNDVAKYEEYQDLIRSVFKKVKIEATEALHIYRSKYDFVFVMLNKLPKLFDLLVKFDNVKKGSTDLFHIISLTRFFMPKAIEEELSSDLLNFNALENLKNPNYITGLSASYQNFKTDSTIDYRLYEVLSIIWLSASYNYAGDIYDEEQNYSPSLLMIFGANFVRDDQTKETGLSMDETRKRRTSAIIEKLRSFLQHTTALLDEVMHCHMAISYLNFQLVSLDDNLVFTKTLDKDRFVGIERIGECEDLINNINFAYEIMTISHPDDPYFRLYITNLKIYYYTEVSSEEEFEELNEIVNWFTAQDKIYPTHWHYRYDDTIARYFYRKSYIIKPENELLKQLKLDLGADAYGRVRSAVEGANKNLNFRDVKEIIVFREQVNNYFSHIVTKFGS